MSSLVLRSLKGNPVAPGDVVVTQKTPLTIEQVDNNFVSLNITKLDANNNLSDLTDLAKARANLNVDVAGTAANLIKNIGNNSNADTVALAFILG